MKTFEQLTQRYPLETFKKGQTLLLRGDDPKAVHVIETGKVKAYIITNDGAERLIALHGKGEDLPVGFGLELTDTSEYFYEAYTNTTIRMVPRNVFGTYLRSDPTALYSWFVRSESLHMATLSRISALEQPRAGDKVAFMLMYMSSQIGTKLRPYKTRLKLAITQQEIADSLGLSRETAGIELKKLEVKKLISHSRKSYVLHMERLRSYLEKR